MADEKPVSKRAGSDNPGIRPKTLLCAEWEAMLVDALDGTLSVREAAAFEIHRTTCPACAQLLDEAKRGGQWLRFLETEPEVPADLVARILASTSGAIEGMPASSALAGVPVDVVQPGWLPGLERHAAESRWIMTAAMAFFSIAFTLNLTGVRLGSLQLSDLAPNNLALGLKRQFYVADAGVVRYYNNLRFVYELESRVRQMKRDVAPSDSGSTAGKEGTTPAPSKDSAQPGQKKPDGGKAEKISPRPKPRPQFSAPSDDWLGDQQGPVMARFDCQTTGQPSHPVTKADGASQARFFAARQRKDESTRERCDKMYGTKKDRAERSLA